MKLKPIFNLSIIAASMAIIIGCDDSSSDTPVAEKDTSVASSNTTSNPLIFKEELPIDNTQCPTGGIKILSGLDENNNTVLDENEMLAPQYVCNGQDGTDGQDGADGQDGNNGYNALVAIVSVAKGDNTCSIGGQQILAGLDINRNNILDTDEVNQSSYLCSNGGLVTKEPIINAISTSSAMVLPGKTVELNATISNLSASDKVIWKTVAGDTLQPKDPSQPHIIEVSVGSTPGQKEYVLYVEQTDNEGNVTVQTKSVFITVGQAATQTQAVVLSSQQVFLPEGYSVKPVNGDITGTLIYGTPVIQPKAAVRTKAAIPTPENVELVGFVAERPSLNSGNTADTILANTISSIANVLAGSTVSQFSKTVLANGDVSASYNISLHTGNEKKATELLETLIQQMAVNQVGGNIDNLVPASTEVAVNEFQLDVVLSYDAAEDTLVMTSTLIAKDKYALYSDLITSTTSENITATTNSTLEVQNDAFTAVDQTTNKADFLFVIDNSGSMSDEQDEISQLAQSFKNTVANAGIDFMVGTITTDSATLRGNGFTNDVAQIETDLKPGTYGSGNEQGIYWSEKALQNASLNDSEDGSVTAAGYPRAGASLSVIIMSDEASHYPYSATFDVNSNLFIDRGYRVYSIVEPNVAQNSQYDDLAVATFGSVLNITQTSEYTTFMDTVANNAGATSAGYKLSLAESSKILSSSISVSVDGVDSLRDSNNGWQYYPLSQSIVFTGSEIPAQGSDIIVAYQYVFVGN